MNVKYKLGLLLGIVLLILILGITTFIAAIPSKHRKIEISTARRKNLTQTITVDGLVEPNKKQVLSLDLNQKVLEVLAVEGQEIRKGDLILKLDGSDHQYILKVEEINLEQAERELAKVLKNEKADIKDVEYSYKQAEIALADAKAELLSSQGTLTSNQVLYETGAISKNEYEESIKNVKSKENNVLLKTMELDRASKSLDSFELNQDEQIFKLRSNIMLIKENINNLKSKEEASTRATIDGKVVSLKVENEQYPTSDNAQILIYDMSKYIINIQLNQQEALYIKEGMKSKIKIKGMDEKEYNGTVIHVDEIATASGSGGNAPKVRLEIVIDNPDENIKIGYAATVKINLNIKAEAIVVDFESIIQDTDGKKYIYYLQNDLARKRPIATGIETSFEVEITEGIIEGDRYVVNPPEEMQAKSSMKIWGWGYESK